MDIVVRAAIVFFILYVFVRAMGRRELAELTPFDLVVLVVIGDLVQQGTTQEDMSITGAVLAAGTMIFLVIAMSWVTFRFRKGRRLLEGVPVVVLHEGRLIPKAMRANRIDHAFLRDAARQQGIADLAEVRYSVLEVDGLLSFVKWGSGGGDPGSGAAGDASDAPHARGGPDRERA